MLFAILVSGALLFYITLKNCSDDFRENRIFEMGTVKFTFESNLALDSLLNYWNEHLEELSVPDPDTPEYDEDLNKLIGDINRIIEKYKLGTSYYFMVGSYLDDNQFQNLTPNEQHTVASFLYMATIDTMIVQDEDGDGETSVSFISEDHLYPGESFILGSSSESSLYPRGGERIPYDPDDNTIKENLYDEPDPEGILRYEKNARGHLCITGQIPIVVNGETRAIYTIIDEVDEVFVDTLNSIGVSYMILILGMLFSGSMVMIFLNRKFLKPIIGIQEEIRDYTTEWQSSELTRKLSQNRQPNEIGKLSDDLSTMADRIDGYVDEIVSVTSEKERITAELDVASRIQTGVLPKEFPDLDHREESGIYASMTPAKEVGGDLYDCFKVDDDHLVLVIGDVSGKGVPAALFMFTTKALIKNDFMSGEKSPAKVLAEVNNRMCEGNDECMFVTLWIGVLEVSSGRMICSNAGHEYPAIGRKGSDFEILHDDHGVPLGYLEDSEYEDYELQLSEGDTIFVYSDGVPEAHNTSDEMFGEGNMLASLNEEAERDPKKIIERVERAVSAFSEGREAFDDITMLCIRL